jgi:hypothetical protein
LGKLSLVDLGVKNYPDFFFEVAFGVYISALFLHVAVKGKAPSTWLPWK